jgi:tetratricopeptide (TPR) repeat protein
MRRTLLRFLFCGFILTQPLWAAQQKPPSAPPGNPSGDAKAQTQQQDSDATSDSPSSVEEDIEVAGYYIRKGDPDAAIPRLEEAIRLRPNLTKPRLMLAEIYEKKGDTTNAVRFYREYLQVFPSAPDARKIQKKIEKLTSR